MRRRALLLGALFALAAGIFLSGGGVRANDGNKPSSDSTAAASNAASKAPVQERDEATMRIEGEKRFQANCSRCHQYPHKFPPRMFATIVRHMRVRATITDEGMRLILNYLTQ
jgi:mono/diheme cytochrome c family protein